MAPPSTSETAEPLALVYDSPGSPAEVLRLRRLPAVEEGSLGPLDIIVDFMMVSVMRAREKFHTESDHGF